jgi:dihydrofolate synthase/folylpolyglutamate synthase
MAISVQSSSQLLNHFPKSIGLGLRPAYIELLEKLGNPQSNLPPVFHVAGTNGKGSTCAFLRSMLEAAGHRVHVYTSPHLVHVHERIRISGQLITEDYLIELLGLCRDMSAMGDITQFEALTAVGLKAFADNHADFTILEVGLGGRLDATNVVDQPLASIITRLSYDHRQHLGDSLSAIAGEKAGIMRQGVACFIAPQPDAEALDALTGIARDKQTLLVIGGRDWRVVLQDQGFIYSDSQRSMVLPRPSLTGGHQLWNAGLAIAALSALPQHLTTEQIAVGLQKVEWPARLQRINSGTLAEIMPTGWELWLDGGHNDSAGEILAKQAETWCEQDITPKPLIVICGMLSTKVPAEFLSPLRNHVASLIAIAIPDEDLSFSAEQLAEAAHLSAMSNVSSAASLPDAIKASVRLHNHACRVLICGSLYLAGEVLRQNGAK